MEQTNTLDYLLQVEAKAANMVKEAQDEADNRIRENEEKSRIAYEECCRKEVQAQEAELLKHKEKIKIDYKNILDAYRNELSGIDLNKDNFFSLLNECIGIR